ncbi:MAG: EamA family transporter [Rectinemataceae bacterium]
MNRNSMHSASRSGFWFAIASAICFSTLGLFAKGLFAAGVAVPTTLAWRFTIASIVLWFFEIGFSGDDEERRLRRKIRADRRVRFKLMLLGLLGFAPQAGLYFVTVSLLDPGITSLLLYLYPAFVVAIAFLFKGAQPKPLQLLALGLSLLGCVITFWQAGNYPWYGLALGVFVALVYALYLVWGETVLEGIPPLYATAVIMTVASIVYWLIAILTGTATLPSSLQQFGLAAGVALFGTVLPVITLFKAMQLIGAAQTSIVSTIEPVCTNIFSMLLFGELITGRRIIGGILILAGVILVQSMQTDQQA